MARLDRSVAAIRLAVRRALRAVAAAPPGGAESTAGRPLALVACSGGADSLALAAATRFVGERIGWRAGLLTVDHRLQPGSDARAAAVAEWARETGFAPVAVLPVTVAGRAGGPEAAARAARYEALARAAAEQGATAVLLGHTRDDQAETVLLALARGAGPRGLAGMPARRDRAGVAWLRPLLDIPREWTRASCRALGLAAWQDPHNADPAYARVRVRTSALPALVTALGERVVDNLARSARQLAADNAALDGWAASALAQARAEARAEARAGGVPERPDREPGGTALAVGVLRQLPDAVRTRVLHMWARQLGAPGSALSHRHVAALDALVVAWRGQGPVSLPGAIRVAHRAGQLRATTPTGPSPPPPVDRR